tara:strand:- start:317 stop:874 length:558 start_codon:yes stop_codon:yes gene_type:complete
MGIIGKDYKYKIVKNFLTPEEINFLSLYCEIKHRTNQTHFDYVNGNADTAFYGDPVMETLMLQKQKIIEKETGKKLLPTYSYWRTYTKFAVLEKHDDRPSCEISTTVFINGDKNWPIYMDGEPLTFEKGDAAIYLGCEIPHWRNEFNGDYQFQTFLHYVDANGKSKHYHMDQRETWGVRSTGVKS